MKNIITNKNELVEYIESGFKTKANHRVGVEFESFLYNKKDYSPLPYRHDDGLQNPSILAVLRDFNQKKWSNIEEKNLTIGLNSNIGSISLEPAGQFEFSSIPAKDIHELNRHLEEYFTELLPILNKNEIGMFFLGFNPKNDAATLPLMPKERYKIMNSYMPKVGSEGIKMMRQTCTLQSNLDFSNESDLKKKMRVSMALQPLIAAMFANSPLEAAKKSSDLTRRVRVWHDTDNARSGILDFVINGEFTIEKYVDYAIMIPMYCLYRNLEYIEIPHITFKEYMTGKYKFPGITPTIEDFAFHLSTLFPDVRLKTYLETRLADCPDADYLLTLPALFTGLLYDDNALENAYNLISKWTYSDLKTLRYEVITKALNAEIRQVKLLNIARELLEIAKAGLQGRKLGEEIYLNPLDNLLKSGKTLAEQKLDLFDSVSGDINEFIKKITLNK